MSPFKLRPLVTTVIMFLLVAAPAARAGMFFEAPVIPLAGESGEVTIADFNVDGKPDMLVGTFLPTGVSVFLGNGDRTFQPAINLPLADTNDGHAVADFDGDGKPDLVVGDNSTQGITFYKGRGDGSFQKGLASTCSNPYELTAGDLNGDGKVDLVTRNWDRNALGINVLLGNGDGTFQAPVYYAAQHLVWVIKLADVNNDGKLDVIGGDFIATKSFISILLGNGDGTFQPHKEFSAGDSPALYSLAVADFNGDGKPDLVANQSNANSLSLLLGNGDGTFQKFVTMPAGLGPYAVAAGDFNQDGKADLACSNTDDRSVSIFLGKGDGTFQARVDFAAGQGPTGLSAADLDQDAKLDLVASGGPVTLLFGLGNGELAAARVYDTGTQGPSQVASGDFNGDGVADLVTNSSFGSLFSLLLGHSDGTFGAPGITDVGLTPAALATGDFNHDGKLDVVSANNGFNGGTVSIVLGNGDGTFQPHVDTALPLHPLWVVTGDFNRDGNLDVAVAEWMVGRSDVSVLLGNGDGTLQPPTAYGFAGRSGQLLVADVDGDGKLDLVIAHSNLISVLPGRGDGTFRVAATTPCPGSVFSLGLGDFDEDGRLDAVVSVENSNAILLGNGDGTFQAPAAQYTPGGGFISIADLNRDGHLDLASGLTSRLGNGDGTLRSAQRISDAAQIAVDFNADGYPDVANPHANAISGWGHTITVELNKGIAK